MTTSFGPFSTILSTLLLRSYTVNCKSVCSRNLHLPHYRAFDSTDSAPQFYGPYNQIPIIGEATKGMSGSTQRSCLLTNKGAENARSPMPTQDSIDDDSDLTPLEDGPSADEASDRHQLTHVELPRKASKRPARSRQSKRHCSRAEDGHNSVEEPPQRKKRKRNHKPDPVYDIPDVERKETTFHGRLGYACLNTVLRSRKPVREAIFCSRTCRIDSIKKNGIDWVKELGRQNAEDMLKIIEWNERNNIRFMRLSSDMFPFASHEVYGYPLTYCAPLLAQVGNMAKKYGHRLTAHPGQFTQLGSPRDAVVQASIRELVYHCEMLDLMDIGPDGVTVIHGGGVYGDKVATLARIRKTVLEDLPRNVRDRLVLENDELCYSAADLLPICEELDIPLVFDYHHDMLNPSPGCPPAMIIERANKIFQRREIKPKQHYSEPREGAVSIMERRAHSNRCQSLPQWLPDDMDLMIEAKDKEQAVLQLHRMYNLQPVIYESLRPPAKVETKQTDGRKSVRKTRLKKIHTEVHTSDGYGDEGTGTEIDVT